MSRLRVHELASELGIPSSELIGLLADRGFPMKSASSALDEEAVVAARGSRVEVSPPQRQAAGSELRGRCECCLLVRAQLAPTKAPDGLPSTPRFCPDCLGHLSSSREAARRDRAHFELYAASADERVAEVERVRHVEATGFAERLALMQQELDERPVRVVTENLDKVEIDQALAERTAALRSRDWAFHDLSSIRLLHRPAGVKCSCGLEVNSCRTLKYFVSSEGAHLDSWETSQGKRVAQGLESRLPDGHPARYDRSWAWRQQEKPGD